MHDSKNYVLIFNARGSKVVKTAGAWGWQPYRHLWTDCLDNVGPLTSHNPIGLRGLLWGKLHFFFMQATSLSAPDQKYVM
jgi:hypothetical protein